VYVDLTLTRSKVKVKVTGLLNFRQLAKPCMLAAMTAAPLRGFLVLSYFITSFQDLANLVTLFYVTDEFSYIILSFYTRICTKLKRLACSV